MWPSFLQRYKTLLRYGVVGTSGTFIDLFSLYLMTELSGINPQTDPRFYLLVTGAFLLAVMNNYVWNRVWTFQSKETRIYRQFTKFMLVALGGYILTQMLMWLLVSKMGTWYMMAKAATSLIVLSWNFILNKMWTFRPAPVTTMESETPVPAIAEQPSTITTHIYA